MLPPPPLLLLPLPVTLAWVMFLHVARWLSAANGGKRSGNELLVQTRAAWIEAYEGKKDGGNKELKEWYAKLAAGAYNANTPELLTQVRCTRQGREGGVALDGSGLIASVCAGQLASCLSQVEASLCEAFSSVVHSCEM